MDPENTISRSVDQTAVVIGAGMGGFMAAAALSGFFTNVIIVERDELPRKPTLRKGVPQGAHVHTFLGYAVQAMDELLPGLMEQLYAAGAVRIRRNFDIWFHDTSGPTPIRDVGLLTPSVTRPLLEHVTRERVLAETNVRINDKTRLLMFESGPDGRVVGVKVSGDGAESETISADLVVDCSGRGSRLPGWLEERGDGAVPAQSLEIAMSYTSGLFRPPPEQRDKKWACLMLAIPPALRAAYLTPVDGGFWLATMYGRAGDSAPRDHEGFLDWAQGLAHPCIHERLVKAEPVTRLRSYNIPKGVWHRFDKMDDFPNGVLPLGEVFTSFNPMYGQGISLAAGQALSLRRALQQCAETGSQRDLATLYFQGCEDLNATGWSVMETRDLAYSSTKGERPADLEERWRMGHAIRLLAEKDPHVHALSVRVTHLLEPPSSLQRPDIVRRALELLNSKQFGTA
jgi:2-polyprenyl-6-methoxyphenol hydroxylase-like FAD-dependent oxidoreductase